MSPPGLAGLTAPQFYRPPPEAGRYFNGTEPNGSSWRAIDDARSLIFIRMVRGNRCAGGLRATGSRCHQACADVSTTAQRRGRWPGAVLRHRGRFAGQDCRLGKAARRGQEMTTELSPNTAQYG